MLKKLTAFAAALVMAASCITASCLSASCLTANAYTTTAGKYKGIDLNGDGKINAGDIVKLAAYIKGIRTLPADLVPKADLNGDGRVNAVDIVILAAHINGGHENKQKTVQELADEHAVIVNQERRDRGISGYVYSPELSAAAMRRAEEISRVFDHARPDGRSCFTVLDEFGITPPTNFSGQYAAENICYGCGTGRTAADAFLDSEYHRRSMLDPNLTYMGIGVYRASDGTVYWVQLFASGGGMSGSEV